MLFRSACWSSVNHVSVIAATSTVLLSNTALSPSILLFSERGLHNNKDGICNCFRLAVPVFFTGTRFVMQAERAVKGVMAALLCLTIVCMIRGLFAPPQHPRFVIFAILNSFSKFHVSQHTRVTVRLWQSAYSCCIEYITRMGEEMSTRNAVQAPWHQ